LKVWWPPETRIPDPLIKSQLQRRPERNIDKKTNILMLGSAALGNEISLFCSGSGTERAQPSTQDGGMALSLPAAFADIDIRKRWSVYY
jgi:hypothetical protein